jgi:hypothetical protein
VTSIQAFSTVGAATANIRESVSWQESLGVDAKDNPFSVIISREAAA